MSAVAGGELVPTLHLTGRARSGLRLYHLTTADVAGAVRHGLVIPAGTVGKFYAWRQHGERWLRVTFQDDSHGGKIVSVAMFSGRPPEQDCLAEGVDPALASHLAISNPAEGRASPRPGQQRPPGA